MECKIRENLTLYYEKSGEGEPLILLHGNGEDCRIFDRAVPLLAKHFTVYAVDSRGHGKSSPATVYNYPDMAEDVCLLIAALGLEKPLLYGFSDGGILGLLIASRRTDLLSRLLVSGANLAPEGIRRGWLAFFRLLAKLVHDPKVDMMLLPYGIGMDDLAAVTVPTTVLAGSHDMIARRHTRAIAAAIPHSTLTVVPHAGHGSYIVHSEKIAHLILQFTGKEAPES